jgi:hypothetical protein
LEVFECLERFCSSKAFLDVFEPIPIILRTGSWGFVLSLAVQNGLNCFKSPRTGSSRSEAYPTRFELLHGFSAILEASPTSKPFKLNSKIPKPSSTTFAHPSHLHLLTQHVRKPFPNVYHLHFQLHLEKKGKHAQ